MNRSPSHLTVSEIVPYVYDRRDSVQYMHSNDSFKLLVRQMLPYGYGYKVFCSLNIYLSLAIVVYLLYYGSKGFTYASCFTDIIYFVDMIVIFIIICPQWNRPWNM